MAAKLITFRPTRTNEDVQQRTDLWWPGSCDDTEA